MPRIRISLSYFSVLAGFALAILGAKFVLVQHYGSDLPFWDQWDAEADKLYTPYVRGELTWSTLWEHHNEHRIVLTKLLALGLLIVNQQWDARLQMVVNAVLHVMALAILCRILIRDRERWATAAITGIGVIIFSLPLAWENTLAGFQSQFYFVILFAILHLEGTFRALPWSTRWWLAQAAGAAGLLSMASGVASAAVVLAVVGLRGVRRWQVTKADIVLGVINLGFILIAFVSRTDVSGHAALRAHSLVSLVSAAMQNAAWPASWLLSLPVILLPHAIIAVRAWREPDQPMNVLLAALSGWWGLQVLLLAYGRGGEGAAMSPRYFDLFSVGIWIGFAIMTHAASTAVRGWSRRGWISVTVLFGGLVAQGFWSETTAVNRDVLSVLPRVNAAREEAVRNYVANKNPDFFQRVPWEELPYPDAHRLAMLLDRPEVRRWLPPSVREPLGDLPANAVFDVHATDVTMDQLVSALSQTDGRASPLPLHAPPPGSASFATDFRFVVVARMDPIDSLNGRLALVSANNETVVPPPTAGGVWQSKILMVPDSSFGFRSDLQAASWMAFKAPVEIGPASVIASALLKTGPGMLLVGWFILLGALGVPNPRRIP